MLKQSFLPPTVISALLFCVYYLLTPWHHHLLLQQQRVLDGAWWQLLTGQLMHHDAPHLWLNVTGVWICWLLFPASFQRVRDSWVIGPILLTSSLGQLIGATSSELYAGFSGTLYGLFAYAALLDARAKHGLGRLVLVGLMLKMALDFWAPLQTDMRIAVYAHLGGILAGLLLAIIPSARQKGP